jgi:hypothetical protein|tara:strand:+ start:136 stop:285 length:150 start_codon:yes stop_codon:yes gene_type:complete
MSLVVTALVVDFVITPVEFAIASTATTVPNVNIRLFWVNRYPKADNDVA